MTRTRTRRGVGAIALALAALVTIVGAGGGQSGHRRAPGPFAWLRPASPPAGWRVVRIASGATLAYPPGWTAIKTDRGTATVALLGPGGQIDGYLNVTPKQGTETPVNWRRFRPAHHLGEGDRDVRLTASATGLTFRGGRGSCVIDSYTTSKASYREIACLATGPRSSTVIVAAAPVGLWDHQRDTLERAVSSFVP